MKEVLIFFIRHSKACKKTIIFSTFWVFGLQIMYMYIPMLYKKIIDVAFLSPENPNFETLFSLAWNVAIISLCTGIGWRIVLFFIIPAYTKIMGNIYHESLNKTLQHSHRFFSENFSGSLVKKTNRLTRSFESLLDLWFFNIIGVIVSLVGIPIVLFRENIFLWSAFFLWAIIFGVLLKKWYDWKIKYDITAAEHDSHISGNIADSFGNFISILSFGSRKKEESIFRKTTKSWEYHKKKAWMMDDILLHSVLTIAIFIVHLLGSVFVIYLWSKGIIGVGTFVLVITYISILIDRLFNLSRVFKTLYISLSDAKEMVDIINLPQEIIDVPNAEKLQISKGDIEFKNVYFGYENEELFKNLNISIQSGEKVGLVGVSGSGKSTLVKLLFRFFNIQSGKILIDGQDISKVSQDSLRQSLGLVPQDTSLFHRTLRENIVYGEFEEKHDEEKMLEASEKSHSNIFIDELEKGYDTYVGERWVKLSGGERQRIAIARIFYKNPSILILDEATSALDSQSESYIQSALENLMKGKTSLVIAHRLSTIMRMDRILVMEKWKIVEQGTHTELLKKNGVYKKLWNIQSGEFIKDM